MAFTTNLPGETLTPPTPTLLLQRSVGASNPIIRGAKPNLAFDGWNPAPVEVGSLSHFAIGFHMSQKVQDFRHQEKTLPWN